MAKLTEADFARLLDIIEPIAVNNGVELWDFEVKPERGSTVLRVFIDKKEKVTIDDCTEVSKQLSLALDVEDIFNSSYVLEVSSPGMDRKLVKQEHYERYAGRKVRIVLDSTIAGRKKYRGRIENAKQGVVKLYDDNENTHHEIKIDDIQTARLEIDL